MTFKQAIDLGGGVRRCEKEGEPQCLRRHHHPHPDRQRERRGGPPRIHCMKGYTVFNVEQIDGFARAIRRACEAASRGKLVAVAPKYRHAGTAARVKNTDGIHLIMVRLYGVAGGGLHPSRVHHAKQD
jgi:antirestriction protein ArdC